MWWVLVLSGEGVFFTISGVKDKSFNLKEWSFFNEISSFKSEEDKRKGIFLWIRLGGEGSIRAQLTYWELKERAQTFYEKVMHL